MWISCVSNSFVTNMKKEGQYRLLSQFFSPQKDAVLGILVEVFPSGGQGEVLGTVWVISQSPDKTANQKHEDQPKI